MQIIDSLISIYDKKSHDCHCSSNTWVIMESDALATFRKLILKMDGATFGIIDNDFYKGLSKMTGDRSSFLTDKDCDGVSFCDYNGNTHLFFVDLKSSYLKIEDAFKQDFFTFMKMHMFLSICNGYSLENVIIDFIAASPPCKNNDEESEILSNLNMADQLNEARYIDKCYLNHLRKKSSTPFLMKDIPFIKKAKLHESIISSSIYFHIFTPDSYGEREGILDLNHYL